MTEFDDDRPYIRSLRVTNGGSPGVVFGRRDARPGAGPARPGLVDRLPRQQKPAVPKALVARYSWRVGLVGFSLVSLAGKLFHVWMTAPQAGVVTTAGGGSVMMADGPASFLPAAIIAGAIGVAWIACAVLRLTALKVDASGISGFTLLGRRHFAWADIDRLQVKWDATYKQQLIVHAVFGSATGGYGIVSPTQIPVMTAKVDRKLDEIIAAIRQYRPDIRIDRSPVTDLLLKGLDKTTQLFKQPQ